jgi:hypothetical protein
MVSQRDENEEGILELHTPVLTQREYRHFYCYKNICREEGFGLPSNKG